MGPVLVILEVPWLVTEINDIFYQVAIVHGSLAECSSEIPGIFVRIDNPKILNYIQNELNPLTSSFENKDTVENKGNLSTSNLANIYVNLSCKIVLCAQGFKHSQR